MCVLCVCALCCVFVFQQLVCCGKPLTVRDRQELHEALREHSLQSARGMKEKGAANDLLDRIRNDPKFQHVHQQLEQITDPTLYVGRAPQQVQEFIQQEIDPLLQANQHLIKHDSVPDLHV